MTAVVAVSHRGHVFMGADSAGVAGLSLTARRDPKVFMVDEFLIGFTSSFRMGQLLAYAFKPPPAPRRRSEIFKYMVTAFVDALRESFKAGGYGKETEGEESGGCFLVGMRGRIFQIEEDYQVGEALDGYNAVGCGADLARGSLFTTRAWRSKPRARVMIALEAAQRHSAGVRAPFVVVSSARVKR